MSRSNAGRAWEEISEGISGGIALLFRNNLYIRVVPMPIKEGWGRTYMEKGVY